MKSVRIEAALLKEIRRMPVRERRKIGRRITEIQRAIGWPHLHKGAGLRKLRDEYFEARIGLKERLLFENTPEALVFEFMGNHDEVKRFLKGR
jgi:mRNA-degrading endonuclease RelE of RelBE toxin-antitoxin system